MAYTGDPWECWWNFDDSEYLVCSHNADFDVDDGGESLDDSSLIVGFEGAREDSGTEYLVSKSRGTTDANDGDMRLFLSRNGSDQIQYMHRVGGGHNWKGVAVGNYLPNYKTVACGQRESNWPAVRIHVDDEDGTNLGNMSSTSSKLNWHGTDDFWIGAHRNSVLTPQFHFTGKIYFVYWLKGVRVLDSWNPYILSGENHPTNGVPYPWQFYDEETYPQMLLTFDNDVAGTYTPEMQTGPNAPYTFTVYGTPVKDCDAFSGLSILGHQFTVEFPSYEVVGTLGHQFTIPTRTRLLRDLSKITRKRLIG